MAETTGTTRRRAGRPKPIPFTYLSPEEQKEYYELTLNAAPTEAEALNGSLNGYHDTGGYIFGRYPSKLTHPDWRNFRDPDRYTFRTYNRYLAQQATIVTHGTETLLASGFLAANLPGWNDDNALELWLEDGGPLAGAREYVEHELTIRDWAEGIIVDAFVAVPLYYEPLLRFFAINGAAHGDASTATIISAFTALAERRLRWGKEFVRLALEEPANHELISQWLGTWVPRAEAALEALAPIYERISRPVLKPGSELERARAQFDSLAGEVGLADLIGAVR